MQAESATHSEQNRASRKAPLATVLVEQQLFDSAEEASRWVMAGQVLVNDQLLDKPGMLIPRDATLRVRGRKRYASRGGYKLEAALNYFTVPVIGRVVLDCGASTGGFTDCLLQHGASLVYAVDAGYGQLIGRLRSDPRVRNLERTNLSDLDAPMLIPPPMLITLDLSYFSLTEALPIATHLLAQHGRILALIKPLFEVASDAARRSGQIDDPELVLEAIQRVLASGATCGLNPEGVIKLALPPRHGVHEFFASFIQRPSAVTLTYNNETLLAIIEGQGIGRSEEE